MVMSRKFYQYLEMTIDFSLQDSYPITQYDFMKKMWRELYSDLKDLYRNSLAADFLFKINIKAELLYKEKKEEYHKTTAKCIWLSQHLQPDL